MAGRRTEVLDIRELIRRYRLGESDRGIARDTGIDRKTVGSWRDWAEGQGFVEAGGFLRIPDLGRGGNFPSSYVHAQRGLHGCGHPRLDGL